MILRAVGLLLAAGTAAGGAVLAAQAPAPPLAVRPAATSSAASPAVPVAAADVVCPGPEPSIAPAGSSPQPAAGPLTVSSIAGAAGGVRVALRTGVTAPLRLAPPPDAGRAGLAAVQTTIAVSGDRRGLAAVACTVATTDAWLVGGATTSGRRARLLLVDPAPAPAVLDVAVLGPAGPVEVPAGRGLVVPPGGARAVQLDAIAPGLDAIAVHVVARRGRVAAVLDTTALDGATPAGVDDVPVAAPPARSLTVPGLVLPRVRGATGAVTVRLAAPGREDAVVHLRLAGPQGTVPVPGGGVVTVPAGSAVDVPVAGIPPGAYAVLADADTPIVAGATVRLAGPPAGPLRRRTADVGWTAATAPLPASAVVALPAGGATATTLLALTAAERDADVTIERFDATGAALAPVPLHVPAGSTAGVAPDGAVALALSVHGGPVRAAVSTEVLDPAGPMLSLVPVSTPHADERPPSTSLADPWLSRDDGR